MDIEFYRNFISIVETGSISSAAKRIGIAQPALSNQLKVMQRRFDTPLLQIRRGGHNIKLTSAGHILYNQAKVICRAESSAAKEIASCIGGFSGTLRLSLSPSMSIPFIRNYLGKFAQQYPKINYELYEVTIAEQTRQLLSKKTEIGVANAPLQQMKAFETLFSRKAKLIALFHKDSPYLKNDEPYIRLEDLIDVPLHLSRGCGPCFLSVCLHSHIKPKILSVNTTKLSTIEWARQNAGVAIVPAAIGETFDPLIRKREFKDERLCVETTISIVKGRTLSAAADMFLKFFFQ